LLDAVERILSTLVQEAAEPTVRTGARATGQARTLQYVVDSGHAELAPEAAVDLGWLLADQGDVAGARAAYQRAIDSDHEYAPLAAVKLGRLLASQGMLLAPGPPSNRPSTAATPGGQPQRRST
jgi:hypothetical protein